MNYSEKKLILGTELSKSLASDIIEVKDFSINELIYSKRVKTKTGPVVKNIKKTSIDFTVSGVKGNEVVGSPTFIYEIKNALEASFGFKFTRVELAYIDENNIAVRA
jgi:hypothetical protein